MQSNLRVGFGVADITPPTGLPMCGSLDPRPNVGTGDPLLAKAMVVEADGRYVVVVGIDLIGLVRETCDPAIAEASRRTGIPGEAMMLSCSHTHSGPYTMEGLYSQGVTNADYLGGLPGLLADSIERAYKALQPATLAIGRSLVHHGIHYRRVLCKDGKAFNTWMGGALNDLEVCPQVLGAGGPIDPEMWVLRFDDPQGKAIGFFVNFSCHVNSRFGTTYSADYPGVIAERLKDAYGPQVTSVFTPGACANINPTVGGARWREGAEFFAEQAVAAAKRAKTIEGPIRVDSIRRDISVPRRDPQSQPSGAVERLSWGTGGGRTDVFGPLIKQVGDMPAEHLTPINAARIGPFAIASNTGEYFVEYGLSIKRRSPFPHTVVAQLTNDEMMYQPTRAAFEQQGYETLVGRNNVALEGIEKMTDTDVELLNELWARGQ